MRITIVGAGSAGKNLAARIAGMGHDVVVVDENPEPLAELTAELDVLTIEGNGSTPSVLERTEPVSCDLFVAVTSSDEVNLISCHLAKKAGAKHTISRVSEASFLHSPLMDLKSFGVDDALFHKETCAREIFNVLRHPGAFEATEIFAGRIEAIGFHLRRGSPLIGRPLVGFRDLEWFSKVRLIGLVRTGELEIPGGRSICMEDDDLYAVMKPSEVDGFMDWVTDMRRPDFRRIIIAGGSDLSLSLARLLENSRAEVVILEKDRKRAEKISERLCRCQVVHGDAAHAATLNEIGIDAGTAFAALTGDQETNIVTCIQAKQLGARFTIGRIDTPEYVPVVDRLRLLDRVVSPYLSLIRAILAHMRGANVLDVGLFSHIGGELQEVAIGPSDRSVGKTLMELKFPRGAIVAAVMRDSEAHIPTGGFTVKSGDRLAVYCLPGTVSKIKSVFE